MIDFPAITYIIMALLLMFLPLDWIFAVVFAGLFHELCHVFAVYVMHGKILRMEICPMGCMLGVEIEDNEVKSVTGNTCKRGDVYARKEVLSPTRIVTSSVKVEGGALAAVSVKTKEDIPKGKIFECVTALKEVCVKAPVHIGDVILTNVAGTGVDVIATKNVGVV